MKKVILFITLCILSCTLFGCLQETNSTIVDEPINQFLNKYAKNYLSKNFDGLTIDYNVLRGIKILESMDDEVKLSSYITKEDASKYIDSLDYSITSHFFKAAVIDKTFDMVSSKPKEALSNVTNVDSWSINYCFGALDYYNVNEKLRSELLTKLQVINESDYRDADYAGITLALTIREHFEKKPLLDLIKNSIVKGGVETWGNINAASTASAIIGLLAEGIDIDKQYLDEAGNSLIVNLLSFEEGGAFKWLKTGEIDFDFSTPQGFLACVCYKKYLQTKSPVEVF